MVSPGVVLLLIVGTVCVHGNTYETTKPTDWWQTAVIYQVWPRSFKDSDGDGIGDLNGIISKLDHFVDMGVTLVWICPFYTSPLIDSGYDVSDFRDVNPIFGTIEDFRNLVAAAHERGLKVATDYVPNHTSDEHEWFIKSKAGVEPYTDYYVWNDGILVNGTRQPPNNWLSVFNSGSAWEWVPEREAYYLHQFHVKQVDLNLLNPLVIQETLDILTYWMDLGVDAFRIDAMPFLIEDPLLRDEPVAVRYAHLPKTQFYYLDHIHTMNRPENLDYVAIWRNHLDEYSQKANDGNTRVMLTEAYAELDTFMEYYRYGSQVPFNFDWIRNLVEMTTIESATDIFNIIDRFLANMPPNMTANWLLGNHDNSRVATRFGEDAVDGLHFIIYLLPGVAITYNGEEIGMTDTHLTWEQTEDPQARSTDSDRYSAFSRDPQRTPLQWDNTTSAGFSTNPDSMLPVNTNYLTVNLAAQKEADVSIYKNVRAAIALRNTPVVREGNVNLQVIDEMVFAFSRELSGYQPVVVLFNWDKTSTAKISLDVFENVPDKLEVLIADVKSDIAVGHVFEKTAVTLPPKAAVVLRGIQRRPASRNAHRRRWFNPW